MEKKFYKEALKSGQKEKRRLVSQGNYPYLPVLEDMVSKERMNSGTRLGVMNVPTEFLVGTKTAGRTNSFAANFMPLLDETTEFANKWKSLCKAHLEEGIREPVKVYEYMNRYYVQEGNKRVSVLKFFGAVSIPAQVTRILPPKGEAKELKLYYEFLDFYNCTEINYIEFSKEGQYVKLQKLVGKEAGEKWSDEERSVFRANYYYFKQVYEAMGGQDIRCSVGDAFFVYLDIFGYKSFKVKSASEIKKELGKIWEELKLQQEERSIDLKLAPEENYKMNFIEKMFSDEQRVVRVAFVHDKTPEESGWTYGHELGRMHVERTFENKIVTEAYYAAMDAPEETIEQAIKEGNEIVFTTSPQLLKASLTVAVKYPDKMILNCSLNKSHRYISTYYARMYEAKFVIGAIAGILAENDKVGYLCDYPIFGQIAGINAFARGVQMVNPKAKVYLEWTCIDGIQSALSRLRDRGIHLISSQDLSRTSANDRTPYGLFFYDEEDQTNLAMPVWHWGAYYEKLIQNYFNKTLQWEYESSNKALNYYWGMSSGVVELICSKNIPEGVRKLVELLKETITTGLYNPFSGPIYTQQGTVIDKPGDGLCYEQIIEMDWLLNNVEGIIPQYDQLNEKGKATVDSAGVLL